MGTISRALLLVTLTAAVHSTSQCLKQREDNCFCNPSTLDSRRGGWELECPDDYRIVYASQSFASLECMTKAPYEPAMFAKLNITDVTYFKIITCPLPNGTFHEIFEGTTVKKLKYDISTKNVTFDSSILSGFDNLEELNLGYSQIVEIEENAFYNLTGLKSLDLDKNRLSSLSATVFSSLSLLGQLQLASNLLETLPETIFANNTKLQMIYLHNNRLRELPSGLFNGLEKLKVLELGNNQLFRVTAEMFVGAMNLEHLNLKGNVIVDIQSDALTNTPLLQVLNLSDNPNISSIPEDLLVNMTKLKAVVLNSCRLDSIPKNFFKNAKNLEIIKLYNNKISFLDESMFSGNELLEELNLKFNNLSILPQALLAKNGKLKKLDLGQNHIEKIPEDFFDNLLLLSNLIMTENQLEELDGDMLKRLDLEELYLDGNNIAQIVGWQPFGLQNLKKLDLSYNNISSFPDKINWGFYISLENLKMKGNKIKFIEFPTFFSREIKIDLEDNEIEMVMGIEYIESVDNYHFSSGTKIENLATYTLEGNPFNCDCKLWNFVKYLNNYSATRAIQFEYPDNYKCHKPLELIDQSILDVMGNQFVCQLTDNCPDSCNCQYSADSQVTSMTCSDITDLPSTLPLNTTKIVLKGNQLASLDAFQDPQWENITVLNLDDTNMTSDEWTIPSKLKILSLRNNQLEWIPETLSEYVSGKQTFNLFLGGNPWYCDCSTLKFKDWLHENAKKVMDIDEIRCQNEVFQNNTNLAPLVIRLTDELCPDDNELDNAKLISVSIICVILALLLFIVSVLYYRNKQTVTAYVFIHFYKVFVCFFNDHELDEDKTFDAFISYSSADREIAMNLIDKLEKGEEPHFKLCIHERDWLPGNLISWNIVNSVQNSRKTILVLSKDFLESMWFQVEFHTAYYQMLEDRIDRLIVIVNGELPEKETLDTDLQFLLSTKTYLEWGERWFWEKLRYGLPHHREGHPKVDMPLRQQPNKGLLRTFEQKLASLTVNGDGTTDSKQNAPSKCNRNSNFIEMGENDTKIKNSPISKNNNTTEIEISELPPSNEEPTDKKVNNGLTFTMPIEQLSVGNGKVTHGFGFPLPPEQPNVGTGKVNNGFVL